MVRTRNTCGCCGVCGWCGGSIVFNSCWRARANCCMRRGVPAECQHHTGADNKFDGGAEVRSLQVGPALDRQSHRGAAPPHATLHEAHCTARDHVQDTAVNTHGGCGRLG